MPLLPTRIARSLAFVLLAIGVGQAAAQSFERRERAMSADACQSALPTFDGGLRKRPLAMVNEGDSGAFVTCALSGKGRTYYQTTSAIGIVLTNQGTETRVLTCTLVDALTNDNPAGGGGPPPYYSPRSITVPADALPHELHWVASTLPDFGRSRFTYPAVSCHLLPGTGVVATLRTYSEE